MVRNVTPLLLVGALLGILRAQEPDSSKLPPAETQAIDFTRDVQPILAKHCVSCHGPKKQSSGLRLDIGAEALKGSNAGPVIDVKEPGKSRLLHLVAGLDPDLKMPPKGERLSKEEIGKLRAWIEQGAKWPKDVIIAAEGGKSDHWAFVAPKRPIVPSFNRDPKGSAWVRNEIDAFILARLEKESIAPSPEADRATLIRRLSFDLRRFGRHIVADPEICHGRLTFAGTRIFVSDVIEMVAEGLDWDRIIWECHGGITREAIAEAVRLAGKALLERGEKRAVAIPK